MSPSMPVSVEMVELILSLPAGWRECLQGSLRPAFWPGDQTCHLSPCHHLPGSRCDLVRRVATAEELASCHDEDHVQRLLGGGPGSGLRYQISPSACLLIQVERLCCPLPSCCSVQFQHSEKDEFACSQCEKQAATKSIQFQSFEIQIGF